MKKLLTIVILIIIIVIILGLFLFNFNKIKNYFIKGPVISNINKAPSLETKQNLALDNHALYKDKIINEQKIPGTINFDLLGFLSFCNYKNTDNTFSASNNRIFNEYWDNYFNFPDYSIKIWGYDYEVYFMKSNNKDRFLNICNEYQNAIKNDKYFSEDYTDYNVTKFNKFYNDCNSLWENKSYIDKEWCDDPTETFASDRCSPILGDEAKECANKINLQTVNYDSLKTDICKAVIPLIQAKNKEDCLAMDGANIGEKLLCLDLYDSYLCTELKDSMDNLKLPDFIAKYQLKYVKSTE